MAQETEVMPKPERKAVILNYFAENDVILPSGLTHTQLVEFRNVTFSEKTTKRMLYELVEEGKMERVDRGGWDLYRITETGRQSLDHTDMASRR